MTTNLTGEQRNTSIITSGQFGQTVLHSYLRNKKIKTPLPHKKMNFYGNRTSGTFGVSATLQTDPMATPREPFRQRFVPFLLGKEPNKIYLCEMQKEELQTISIYFDKPKTFEPSNIKPLSGIVGLYFIFTQNTFIQYPFDKSKLLYIGMSEKKTNSIGSRLTGHFEGKSKNIGLVNYRKVESLLFTYLNFDILKANWDFRIEDLESYFILSFVEHYGVYPICNNKTGFEILKNDIKVNLKIDWNYFKN